MRGVACLLVASVTACAPPFVHEVGVVAAPGVIVHIDGETRTSAHRTYSSYDDAAGQGFSIVLSTDSTVRTHVAVPGQCEPHDIGDVEKERVSFLATAELRLDVSGFECVGTDGGVISIAN